MSGPVFWISAALFVMFIFALDGSIESDCAAGNYSSCHYLDTRDWR